MTNEKIAELKGIVCCASSRNKYVVNCGSAQSYYTTHKGVDYNGEMHNLSDLRTIVNQHEEIERLRARVAELEQELKISERNNRLCLRKIEQLKEQGDAN